METFEYSKTVKEPDKDDNEERRRDAINRLCQTWSDLKQVETDANKARKKIEQELAELVNAPIEGTTTVTTGVYQCKAVGNLKRKLDVDCWLDVAQEVPEALWPVKTKLVIDLKKLKAIETGNPELFLKIARSGAITSEPGNPSIKVEALT